MNSVLRFGLVILLMVAGATIFAQPKDIKPGNSSISGRVAVGDKPLPGISLSLSAGQFGGNLQKSISTKTDADGRYKFSGLAADSYRVVPNAMAYVFEGDRLGMPPGKAVIVGENEALDKIDFSLIRGGVITGKITDADGHPVIEQRVQLEVKQANGQKNQYFAAMNFFQMGVTDDRGIYRIFGLPAGKYFVSAGEGKNTGGISIGGNSKHYPQTFYPSVENESEAQIVEVTEGSEATDINIRLGKSKQTYEARGRIIDATTGQPLGSVGVGYGAMIKMGDRTRLGGFGNTGERTNAKGEFRISGLSSGTYGAFLQPDEGSEYYSEPAIFEVADSDFNGLEVNAQRGASLSGVVIIDGAVTPTVQAQFRNLGVFYHVQNNNANTPMFRRPPTVNPDGTFQLKGLQPGKGILGIQSVNGNNIFSVLRMEKDGADITRGFDVTAGAQLTGVKITVGSGSGIIRGQVNFVGGTVPPGARLGVSARRLNSSNNMGIGGGQLDARGRFVIENLIPGEYELNLNPPFVPGQQPSPAMMRKRVTQNVTVGTGEASVTLTMDLSEDK